MGKRYARVATGWSVPHGVMFGSVRMVDGFGAVPVRRCTDAVLLAL
ncbi:hypothetical protein AB0Y02_14195 [Phocaeicola dorei]